MAPLCSFRCDENTSINMNGWNYMDTVTCQLWKSQYSTRNMQFVGYFIILLLEIFILNHKCFISSYVSQKLFRVSKGCNISNKTIEVHRGHKDRYLVKVYEIYAQYLIDGINVYNPFDHILSS